MLSKVGLGGSGEDRHEIFNRRKLLNMLGIYLKILQVDRSWLSYLISELSGEFFVILKFEILLRHLNHLLERLLDIQSFFCAPKQACDLPSAHFSFIVDLSDIFVSKYASVFH